MRSSESHARVLLPLGKGVTVNQLVSSVPERQLWCARQGNYGASRCFWGRGALPCGVWRNMNDLGYRRLEFRRVPSKLYPLPTPTSPKSLLTVIYILVHNESLNLPAIISDASRSVTSLLSRLKPLKVLLADVTDCTRFRLCQNEVVP